MNSLFFPFHDKDDLSDTTLSHKNSCIDSSNVYTIPIDSSTEISV
jgi:hypothetical protein